MTHRRSHYLIPREKRICITSLDEINFDSKDIQILLARTYIAILVAKQATIKPLRAEVAEDDVLWRS